MKKKIAVLLASALLFSAFSVTAYAEDADGDHSKAGEEYFNPTEFHEVEDTLEDYENGRWAVEPTCTEDGVWRYDCSHPTDTGMTFHEVVVPADGHIWSSDVDGVNWGRVIKEPTCTEEGEAEDYCVVCGEVNPDIQPRIIEKLDHEYEYVMDTFEKATCVSDGKETGHYECKNCGAVKTDPKTGEEIIEVETWTWEDPGEEDDDFNEAHDWDGLVREEDPTCADSGLDVQWCKRCGLKREIEVDPLEAQYEIASSRLLNCYEEEITYSCVNCNGDVHEDYTEVRDARAHTFRDTIDEEKSKEATCTEWGYDIIKCEHYDDEGNDQARHDELLKEETKTFTDSRGNKFESTIPYYEGYKTVEIAPTDHQWGKWVKRHGAGEGNNEYGYWIRECTVCHTTDELVTKDEVVEVVNPTCTEDGKLVYLDGSEEVIPATGHTEVEIPAVEPTVDSVGFTAGTKCAVCGEILVAPEEIPALKDGFVKDDDGEWRLYKEGEVEEDFTGIYEYDGGEFYLDKGVLQDEANGLNLVKGTWYFLSQGQIQRKDGFAEYDDNWFMIDNGELDKDANGLYTYKTDEGEGVFLFAAGRLRTDVNGLWQDHYGTYGPADTWYFLADGQVVDFTGVAEYNGSFFVVEKGVFNDKYNGTIKYDGATFNVVNGQLYGQVG
jgi:hypothetical protein